MKVKQTYIEKYAKPYPTATKPKLGSNGLVGDNFETKQIELLARGKAEVDGTPMEFMDLRVYIN
jgi:hypothetical protein